MKLLAIALPFSMRMPLFLLFALNVSAQDSGLNPYNFGSGNCSSRGNWTAQALSSTREIIDVVQRLKADPKCRGMAESFERIGPKLKEALEQNVGTSPELVRSQGLLNEMRALSQFASQNNDNRMDVVRLLLHRSVNYATESTKIAAPEVAANSQQVIENLFSLGRRLHQTSNSSLGVFNELIDSAATNRECVMDNPASGAIFASGVNILSSFLGNGQNHTGSQLSNAINKFFMAFRDMKYSNTIRAGNENMLLNSISCLLEVTAENYCSARDAAQLFQESQGRMEVQTIQTFNPANREGVNQTLQLVEREGIDMQASTPLTGFYIMTQQLPVINEWLLKIMLAIDPQVTTDAAFRNEILDDVNTFFKGVNDLRATYNYQSRTILSMTDPMAQRNGALALLNSISDLLGPNSSNTNFFTLAIPPVEIPFALSGIPFPRELAETNTFSAANYIKNRLNLNDPAAFLNILKVNLESAIRNAQMAAITSHNKWAIVDKQAVVNSALLGVNFNVPEILTESSAYLNNLERRATAIINRQASLPAVQRTVDPAILGSLADTQARIRKILVQLAKVRETSVKFSTANQRLGQPDTTTANFAVLMEARTAFELESRNFITVVYDELNVLLSRTGFLANRMTDFVQFDFQMNLRDQANAGQLFRDPKFEQDLKYATNVAAYNQILGVTGSNPALVRQDIANAMNIGKLNLQMIERTFKDYFARKIAELQIQATTPQAGRMTLALESYYRFHQDQLVPVPTQGRNFFMRAIDGALGRIRLMAAPFYFSDRYHSGLRGVLSSETILPSETEFATARAMYSQYCIQALAFGDLRGIWNVCQNAELKSPYIAQDNAQTREAMARYLNIQFRAKALENFPANRPLNESNRICALRDFYRRNYVLYLTRGLNTANRNSVNEQVQQELRLAPTPAPRAQETAPPATAPATAAPAASAPTSPAATQAPRSQAPISQRPSAGTSAQTSPATQTVPPRAPHK